MEVEGREAGHTSHVLQVQRTLEVAHHMVDGEVHSNHVIDGRFGGWGR